MAEIRAMNRRVTERASLIFLSLIMERRNAGCRRIDGQSVAFQADEVHLGAFQKTWVARAVGRMTGDAPFRLRDRMLEHKRSFLLEVAFEANRILGRGCAQLPCEEAAVRVMAIRAAKETLIDAVPEGSGEFRSRSEMAFVAERGFRGGEQVVPFGRMVRRVTA
jgi:hypothetical protein